ncbi:hypothetical protein B0H11DRAFT_2186518 [Mycena galericulata]|nr:hypothetical protein B0H11DRAFT_2186518 [Mycena galericulata]
MGQYWKLLNLDRRQTYGSWGKLGECLFDGSPNCLDSSLRPPTKLPDCDSLIFPFKPGAPFLDQWGRSDEPKTYCFPKPAARRLNVLALVNLPVEMIQEIYSNVDDLADVFCLSMTCQFLWDIGRRDIYRRVAIMAASYSWAGDRIICVGDYLRTADLPASILAPEEEEELLMTMPEDEDSEYLEEDADRCLYSYPFDVIGPRRRSRFTMNDVLMNHGIFERFTWNWRTLDILQSLCDFRYETPVPTESAVLRNLTKREYVTESALTAWREGVQANIKEVKDVGFGEIVFSRVCFSTSPSVAMVYDGDIHRGVWAGDRFDLVTSDWLEGLDDAAWTDVSDEVLKEVEAIWRSENQ